MDNKGDYIELVEKAKLGDKDCMNQLAELARQRLHVFAYRLTLREDLSQDIVQESLLEMFKVLGKLKRADRFWPWIYTITYNKIRRHWRSEKKRKSVSIGEMDFKDNNKDSQSGLENLVADELKEIVMAAMRQLKDSHRAVLTMRCYDNMKYSEIAELMGSSELGARMLFLRAKKSLGKHLSRRGLGSGALLTALVVFGKVTAPTQAAAAQVTVTAAATQVGVTASVIGAVTSKAALITVAAAGTIAAGTAMLPPNNAPVKPAGSDYSSSAIHSVIEHDQFHNSIEKRWDYYPDGSRGAVMSRLMISDSDNQSSYCLWLQDDRCNYYFDKSTNTVYLKNSRAWSVDLSVPILPSDDPDMFSFLSRVQGSSAEFSPIAKDGKGLLVMSSLDHSINSSESISTEHPTVLIDDYFKNTWPDGIDYIDNRDEIHRQGWCFFKVEGSIGSSKVSGTGRLPLYYAYSRVKSPWLKLNVSDPSGSFSVLDSSKGASIEDPDGENIATFSAGNFFKGLSRQWMGLHTIDTIRRDAARKRIMFHTQFTSDQDKAKVSVQHEGVTAVYTVDMEKDLIDRIDFSRNTNGDSGIIGSLKFTYLQNSDLKDPEFTEPVITLSRRLMRQSDGTSWLSKLAEGTLKD